jgi:signal transduction histidine kinase/CheY-like chemotaxis protein
MPHVFLLAGCVLSVIATWFVASTTAARSEAAFLADAKEIRQQIQAGLDAYVEVIRAGTALLAATQEINHAEFRAFVSGLQLPLRYPGMAGIGFSEHVQRAGLNALLRAVALDGIRGLRVWPRGARPEYDVVISFEPGLGANQAALGFDLWTDPVRRDAMERARDSGQPTASEKPTDPQPFDEDSRPADLVLFMPVYRSGTLPLTVEERRRALIGFVFTSLRFDRLFPRITATPMPLTAFDVHDAGIGERGPLIYQSAPRTGPVRFESTEPVQIAGRSWLVAVRSLEPPSGLLPQVATRTLIVSLLLSVLLFLTTRDQVRAWQTAARHEAELRAADRAKDEFLATLSHELRTPLNAIFGWVSMLRKGALSPDQQAHAIEVIERNARHQAQLVEDLLDVSRILAGKVQLQLSSLRLGPVVSTTLESLRPTAEAKGITLKASLPETSGIQGDSGRIQQVIWNLLANAIKFTPSGGHVSVELSEFDRRVELRVRDTGIGIAPEFLPQIFERFRQADSSTTRAHGGMGLGLAIVRHLVELHGGSIEARSEGPDRGALFIVRFPAMPGSAMPVTEHDRTGPPDLDGVKVLVVDDDRDTRDLLSQALSASGARVTTADSAAQAFQRLGVEPPDVLISDIGMPGEDGFSLIRRIRALPDETRHIPAIALTAYARPEDRDEALDAGYQMYFAKPVELTDLQTGLATLARQETLGR